MFPAGPWLSSSCRRCTHCFISSSVWQFISRCWCCLFRKVTRHLSQKAGLFFNISTKIGSFVCRVVGPYRENKLDKSKYFVIRLRFCERKRSLIGGLVVPDQVLFGPLFFVLEMVLGRSQASDALLSSVKQAIKLVNLIDTHTCAPCSSL